MDDNRQRIVFLDWLRAVACLIQGFVRPVAVPLFLMASAYLLVPVTRSTGEFLKKRFTRVAIPFVVFLFLYAFLPALWGEFSWTEAWTISDHACDISMASESQ